MSFLTRVKSYPMFKTDFNSHVLARRICDRQKDPKDVLQSQIDKYRDVFRITIERANLIDIALADYLDERPTEAQELEISNPPEEVAIFKCPRCGSNMVLKDRKQGTGKYIGCMGFPPCNNAIWFPQYVESIEALNEVCSQVSITLLYNEKDLQAITVLYIFSVSRKQA